MPIPQPTTNRLASATSPYLLQHADNPVEWYQWGPEALERAIAENKPILLSVGYSACHWCHVMAHESFEDEDTAALMNTAYINIKVDREERPDLDRIYQMAHHLLAQRTGGWPLTMFLTPDDHTPFFGGTYFPPQPRHGLPSFREVLLRVAEFYRDHRDEIRQQGATLRNSLASLQGTGHVAGEISPLPLDATRRQLGENFDPTHGGFGAAPKFPHPTSLERLLRHWAATRSANPGDKGAMEMLRLTLDKMAQGGVYDQLGGGFCRYSVDDYWMIPHFEKMLYDNSQLVSLYCDAWLATGHSLYRDIVQETAAWVIREMQSPQGGYYSTLDADSEGVEGKFYAWTREEVRSGLGDTVYPLFARRYGLDRPANFEGKWHLHVFHSLEEIAHETDQPVAELQAILDSARRKLLGIRDKRVPPGRDEKILTAWNGLMIKGMARAGRVLGRQDFVESAQRALGFVRTRLWRDGRLLATCKDDKAHLMAYLDDYAFLIDGILELLQTRWNTSDLDFATKLADTLLEFFQDTRSGGFFFTAADHEPLIHRPKPFSDEATPSGNGIAAQILGRLGHLLGETRYLEAAEKTLKAAWNNLEQVPWAHNALLTALEETLYPPQLVILRGDPTAMESWRAECEQGYQPRRLTFAIPDAERNLPTALAARVPGNGVRAYVCTGTTCAPPVDSLDALKIAVQ